MQILCQLDTLQAEWHSLNCFRRYCWNITSLAVAYALNDSVSLTGKTDQAAGAESVQTIGASTTLNGVSVSVSSANNSTWDVDLGYTAGGFALTYGVDETDGWTATATTALGGGATFAAGVDSDDDQCMQAYHSHSNPNWI